MIASGSKPANKPDETKIAIDGRIDPSFRKINKNTIGFHIWKVENDRIETVPKSQFGTFSNDCTYIVYAAAPRGSFVDHESISRDIKPPTNGIERFIHFWLGENTTPTKSGAVAYKVIELDVHLGYSTTQYREVQSNESSRFLSYFRDGITVLCANAHPESNVRLFQIRGKKCPTCVQKSSVEWTHFSSANVMIFQTHKYLFVWIGRSSSASERLHGLNMAVKIREVIIGSLTEIAIIDDGYEQSMDDDKKCEWNKYLNLSQRFVHPVGMSKQLESDDLLKLYKCGHSNGKYRIEEIKTSLLEQTDLIDTDAAYIIDNGEVGVWIWIGRGANAQDKAEAMRNARGFVKKKKYSSETPVIRVVDGHEPEEFIRLFPIWTDVDTAFSIKAPSILGKFDSVTLMQRPKLSAQTQLIDDGSGDFKIYRVEGGNLVELPKSAHGALYSGDVYILLYQLTLTDNIKDASARLHHVAYLWIGRTSSINDKTNGGNSLTDIIERLGKSNLQVRIHEGHETPHFLQIFKGRLIIFNGRSIDYDVRGKTTREPRTYVLKIVGNSTYSAKAIQVSSKTIYTSNDCFVLKTSDRDIWVWCGHCSTGDAREIAKSTGSALGEYTLVIESNEPDEFWMALNEKISHNFRKIRANSIIQNIKGTVNFKPALFIAYLENEQIKLNQIIGFEQKDLAPEDIYLLDAGSILYIWVGSLSPTCEFNIVWSIASYLISKHPTSRDPQTPIALIKQGCEPPTFIGFFDSWSPKYLNDHKSFNALRGEIEPSNTSNHTRRHIQMSDRSDHFDRYQKYPIEVLRAEADCLPQDIDPKRKEVHLAHDDFVAIFKMPFDEFEVLPGWRKQELKKKNKLF